MKHSSRGFTLVELLLAMALFSTILTVVAVALGGLARADRASRDQIDRQRTVQRFIMRLRQDIHQADTWTISPETISPETTPADDGDTGAETTPAGQTFTLTWDDGRTIQFQSTTAGLVRTETRDDQAPGREFFAWGSQSVATWAIDNTQELPMVVLTLTIEPVPGRAVEQIVVRTTLLNNPPDSAE